MGGENEQWQVTNIVVDSIYSHLFNAKTSDFKFEMGALPLSNITEVALSLVVYLSVVFGLREFMKSRDAMPLKSLFALHNFLLTLASLVLLLLLLELIVPKLATHGLFWTICSEEMFQDKRLEFVYYLNYLSKYWELVDTVFLVLQKKPLKFLHVYHHSLTMVLCFTQLWGTTTVQWVPIILNVFVHVVMYYYYFLSAIDVKNIWWKQHVTTIQIVQFIIDIVVCYYCLLTRYSHDYHWDFIPSHYCHGDVTAAWYGCLLLTSYLYLFIEFFYNTYVNPKKKDQRKKTK